MRRIMTVVAATASLLVVVPSFAEIGTETPASPLMNKGERIASLKTLTKMHEERAKEWEGMAKYDSNAATKLEKDAEAIRQRADQMAATATEYRNAANRMEKDEPGRSEMLKLADAFDKFAVRDRELASWRSERAEDFRKHAGYATQAAQDHRTTAEKEAGIIAKLSDAKGAKDPIAK